MHKLQLVSSDSQEDATASTDPVQRVFQHWIWMFDKNARRVALGPTRRKAIAAALGLYDVETVMLAIDGNAASRWHAGENDRGVPFNDLELILRDEKHIERFAGEGERVRMRAQRQVDAATHAEPAAPDAVSEIEAAALRQTVRELARELSGRR